MSNIKILDCTLRDGGYVNNWHFGQKAIETMLFNFSKSNADIVECGFLTNKPYDPDYSLYNSVEQLNDLVSSDSSMNTMYVAMIAIGEREINPVLLSDADSTVLDGIRLTFHPNEIDLAFEWAEIIKSKGYKIFMQPVGTTNYTDKQFIDLLERINKLEPYAFYIVDTLGVMYEKDLIRQVFAKIPDTELSVPVKGNPDGEYFMRVEQPRGEAYYYVKGHGKPNLDRARVRTPTFANIPGLCEMLKNCELSDVGLLVVTIDPCISCTER